MSNTVQIVELTAEQALATILTCTQVYMSEMCLVAHKEIYGVDGHWMQNKTVAELADWWTSCYTWNIPQQCWIDNAAIGCLIE